MNWFHLSMLPGGVAAIALVAALLAPAVTSAEVSVEEGETATFDVTLTQAGYNRTGCKVEYNYFTEGDSATSQDFERKRGKLTYYAGDTTLSVDVETYSDNCRENDETFKLVVKNRKFGTVGDLYSDDLERCSNSLSRYTWKEKTFYATITDDGTASRGSDSYENQKYGCRGSSNTFGE